MKDKKKQAQAETPEETLDTTETVETDVAEEAAKPAETQPVADEWHDRFVRLAADFDNFKKRSAVEKTAAYTNATADTVAALLPVIDDLERAIAAAEDSPMKEGVEMVLAKAMKVFENLNVVPVGQPGDPFDPHIHNAVMHVDDETMEENVIAEVFQKGYKLGDKVVRPAMVKVAN